MLQHVLWQAGLALGRHISAPVFDFLPGCSPQSTGGLAARRREIVIQTYCRFERRPGGQGRFVWAGFDHGIFFLRSPDLWRYESGVDSSIGWANGWLGTFKAAHARGKGVLLVTPHLATGIGGAFLVEMVTSCLC